MMLPNITLTTNYYSQYTVDHSIGYRFFASVFGYAVKIHISYRQGYALGIPRRCHQATKY